MLTVCMYVCMYVCINGPRIPEAGEEDMHLRRITCVCHTMCVLMYVCMYDVCMCVCMYVIRCNENGDAVQKQAKGEPAANKQSPEI